MGVYRFLLATSVVFFHVGGGHWPLGRAAVFRFYFVSGFVIARVLDRNYWGSAKGLTAFYANRALRLLPLYAAITLITIVVVALHGSTIFIRSDGDPVHPFPNSLPLSMSALLPLPNYDSGMLTGRASAIPQGWSVGVEICFYLAAPLLVFVGRRSKSTIIIIAALLMVVLYAVALSAPDVRFLDIHVYRNAFTSFAMFACGSAAYFVYSGTEFRMGLPAAVGILAVFSFALNEFGQSEMTKDAFLVVTLLVVPVSAAICFVELPKRLQPWDWTAGDLSYGIYLNHFLVAVVMLWLGEVMQWHPFGRFGAPAFSWWAIPFCIALAFAGLRLIEKRFQLLKIGQTRPNEIHPNVATQVRTFA